MEQSTLEVEPLIHMIIRDSGAHLRQVQHIHTLFIALSYTPIMRWITTMFQNHLIVQLLWVSL